MLRMLSKPQHCLSVDFHCLDDLDSRQNLFSDPLRVSIFKIFRREKVMIYKSVFYCLVKFKVRPSCCFLTLPLRHVYLERLTGDSFLGLQVDKEYRMQRSSTGRAYSMLLIQFIYTGLTDFIILSNDRMVLEQRLKGLGKLSTYHSSHDSISYSHKLGFMQASKVLLSAIPSQVF